MHSPRSQSLPRFGGRTLQKVGSVSCHAFQGRTMEQEESASNDFGNKGVKGSSPFLAFINDNSGDTIYI